MIPAHESAHQTVTCSLWRGHDIDGQFAGCLHFNHALRVLGQRLFAMGENGGDDAKFYKHCGWKAAACVRAEWCGDCKIKFLTASMCTSTMRYFTAFLHNRTNSPEVFYPQHNGFMVWRRNLKLGMERMQGHDNWVVVVNNCLNSKSSLCIWPRHFTSDGRTRVRTERYKTSPSTLSSTIIATALNFTRFSLHSYGNREVILPHPVVVVQ